MESARALMQTITRKTYSSMYGASYATFMCEIAQGGKVFSFSLYEGRMAFFSYFLNISSKKCAISPPQKKSCIKKYPCKHFSEFVTF